MTDPSEAKNKPNKSLTQDRP